MNPVRKIKSKIDASPVGHHLLSDRTFRAVAITFLSMGWNAVYGVFNGVLGIVYGSVWFATMCVYYLMLGYMRLWVTSFNEQKARRRTERGTMKLCGIALIFLAVVLSGSVVLSFKYPVAKKYDKIIMITIATYTFVIAFLAVRNSVKAQKEKSLRMIALRNISLGGATASILSLQRSMIPTFGDGGSTHFANVMEGATGMGAFVIITALGVSMLVQSRKNSKNSPR